MQIAKQKCQSIMALNYHLIGFLFRIPPKGQAYTKIQSPLASWYVSLRSPMGATGEPLEPARDCSHPHRPSTGWRWHWLRHLQAS